MWVVVDDDGMSEPDVWLFDSEHDARGFASQYIKNGNAEDVWIVPLTGDNRKEGVE